MKYIHTLTLTVFIKPDDNETHVREGFLSFFPFDLGKEKVYMHTDLAQGFEEKTIRILSVTLTKQAHTAAFLEALLAKLTSAQKETILSQAQTRVDDEYNFFLRFDKNALITHKTLEITDKGNCYHLKMNIACYPRKKEVAIDVVKKMITEMKE